MPKTTRDFPEQISVGVGEELKQRVIAFSYLSGNGGMYAATVRNFLHDKLMEEYSKLEGRQKADYEEILANVKTGWVSATENKKAPA